MLEGGGGIHATERRAKWVIRESALWRGSTGRQWGARANGEDWKVDAAEGQVVRLEMAEMAGETDLVSLHSLQTRRTHTTHTPKPN